MMVPSTWCNIMLINNLYIYGAVCVSMFKTFIHYRLSFYDGMVKIVVMMKRNEDDDDEDDDDDVSKANIFSKASSLECWGAQRAMNCSIIYF